jgi:hypothetical protein
MTEPFATVLAGGHHNSLGRTAEVVEITLSDQARLDELFGCLASPDELVRMRAGDALEKICRERPAWFVPHVERLLGDVAGIDQPSVQWHLAQMLQHLRDALSRTQMRRATELLQRQLASSTDWIVLNVTMDVLTDWADETPELGSWLRAELDRLRQDRRPSVAKRAAKRLAGLGAR